MGMDVYGLNPKKNTKQPNVLKVPEGVVSLAAELMDDAKKALH